MLQRELVKKDDFGVLLKVILYLITIVTRVS